MRNDMEKVSVIIPAYNVERFIAECVNSVREQTYKNLEIIIVDDGSSDGTLDICQRIAVEDDRIKVLQNNHGGVSRARNAGLDNATGGYIMSVDSDDVIAPDMIETLYNKLKEHNADVVACGCSYMSEDGGHIGDYPPPAERVLSGRDALEARDSGVGVNAAIAAPWGKLAKKAVYDGKRYKEGVVYEDMHLMPYLYFDVQRFVIIPYCGYKYRQREGSIMHRKEGEREYKFFFDIWADHAEFYREKGDTVLEYYVHRNAADKILMACRKREIPEGLDKYSVNEFKKHYKFLKKHAPNAKEKFKYFLFRLLGVKGYRSIRKKV